MLSGVGCAPASTSNAAERSGALGVGLLPFFGHARDHARGVQQARREDLGGERPVRLTPRAARRERLLDPGERGAGSLLAPGIGVDERRELALVRALLFEQAKSLDALELATVFGLEVVVSPDEARAFDANRRIFLGDRFDRTDEGLEHAESLRVRVAHDLVELA